MSTSDSVFLCALGGNERSVTLWLNENVYRSNASKTRIIFGWAKNGHSHASLQALQQPINAVDFTAMHGTISDGLKGEVPLEFVFRNACRHGNISIVDFLISNNYKNYDSREALNVASMHGHEKLVGRLLSAYEVNDKNKLKWRLTLACALNDKTLMKYLIKYENFTKENLIFALVAACFRGRKEAMTILLNYINIKLQQYEIINRTSPSYTLHGRITPLLAACVGCHTKIVEAIFEFAPDVDVHCCTEQLSRIKVDGRIPYTGDDNVLHVVIMATSRPPLIEACYTGDIKRVKNLLKVEPINAQDSKGNTPLHVACQEGHTEIGRVLLSVFADTDVTNNWLQTPADVAILKTSKDLLSHLDTTFLDETRVHPKSSALYRTPFTGDDNDFHDVVIMETSRPSLNEACYKWDIEQVRDLLKVELVNAQDSNGDTPLHLACQDGHTEIVRILLSVFADRNLQSSHIVG